MPDNTTLSVDANPLESTAAVSAGCADSQLACYTCAHLVLQQGTGRNQALMVELEEVRCHEEKGTTCCATV